ncbi:hypothetical protein Q4601_19750 [Shewanella sp. 1_MG-2023]|uniref:hypothetical protein n=1 Tax=unclassified Shewanella TaxID=196818 RepID=UPI0026E14C0A|nr:MULTISPECIES: hypothetical protein [unclassified Shewanella]MDO6613725.1 hypothetical protein [Shewanella sp. 7_MG-2023]MDO6772667.1 hypothetical protein [Shewanella sp. 2_MG-2023]MDO6796529.1 hypothetical protein [Shewanella sp. 1_MG-2023]
MKQYFKTAFKADNLPNWINLLALVAVFFSISYQFDAQSIQAYKADLIKVANKKGGIIEKTDDERFSSAIAELLRDGIATRIRGGYELSISTPRFTNDIYFAANIVSRDLSGKEISCSDISKGLLSMDNMLIKIEKDRSVDSAFNEMSFRETLSNYRYMSIKALVGNDNIKNMKNQSACIENIIHNR